MDEEVQFGGNTAQTGLDQPAQVTEGEERVKLNYCSTIVHTADYQRGQ